jgi:drug/metabolite transporter (DMT)-like permease
MYKRFRIHLGFIIICLLWGTSWAAVKIGLESIPPFLSLAIRFSIASVILGIIIVLKRLGVPKNRKFWKLAVILCITSFTIPFILIYWAQIQVSSGLASVLFATFPFWVAILSLFFLPNEKISIGRIIGLIFGFLGIIFVFYDGFLSVNNRTLLAMSAIIIGAIIQASGLIALRRSSKHMNPVSLNFWPMLLSIAPFLIASLLIEDYSSAHFDQKAIGSLVYLSVFCTVITFVIYFWLVKRVEAIILSLSAFITPVVAVIIGILFMNEDFTSTIYIGSLLVLIGIAIVTIGDKGIIYLRKIIRI